MKKIGFIGTGLMGYPMAKNLLMNGFKLKVFNRTIKKAKPLKKYGAIVSNSIGEVVKDVDVVITMLTDDHAVSKILGNQELLSNLKKKSTVIDMSSTKPGIAIYHSKKLKKKNIKFLDAPVSGGTIGAKKADLAIMVGGNKKVFNNCIKVLKKMGNPTLVGPTGSGQIAKLANQIIVGVTIGATAEAIILCEKSKVDPVKFIEALAGGFADSKILRNHGKRMIEKDFAPGGKVLTHLKDMNNILECANDLNTQLPISKLIKFLFRSLVINGNQNDDHSAIYKEIKRLNK